jgi:hypothetical protein
MAVQPTLRLAIADSSSNYNSIIYPSTSSSISVQVGQIIQGTSTNSGPLSGCPSGQYNWDYQSNMLQDSGLGNSWIQQVIEVSQTGNSCYTVEFYPDVYVQNPQAYFYSFSIAPSNILYDAASSSNIAFWMSYSGNPSTVSAFYISACCSSNGNTIAWVIYPSQLENSGYQLNSPIQFDSNSQEDFNIVGTGLVFVGGARASTATFSSGEGQISCCSYNNAGLVSDETGEQSNMVYSALTQSVCGGGNTKWFYQSFAPGTVSSPSLNAKTVNQNGETITGYYVGLYNNAGTLINSGFSPVTFTDLTATSSYYVSPDNYGSCSFSHWQDTGNTTRDRYFTAYGSQVLTAVYNCSSTGTGSVTVNTENQNGQTITGYYVGLYNSGGTLVNNGYSPVTFSNLSIGTAYSVEPDNYGSCTFNHWQDTGSTTRDRSFTAANSQTFVAVYDCT